MMRPTDHSGKRFGKLTAVVQTGSRSGRAIWKCLCDCGTETSVLSIFLTSGSVKSCGCLTLRRKSLAFRIEAQSMPVTECGCWIWMGSTFEFGYGQTKHNGKTIGAHRASWMAYKGDIPDGMWVLHRCDIPSCVNPDHLFLGTHADNMADKTAKGRAPRGEENGFAYLTAAEVAEIKRSTDTQKSIGSRFGVHQSHVSRIKSGKVWSVA